MKRGNGKTESLDIYRIILFVFGLGGFGYETLHEHTDRVWLLFFFGGMVGLPGITRVESIIKKKFDISDVPEKEIL